MRYERGDIEKIVVDVVKGYFSPQEVVSLKTDLVSIDDPAEIAGFVDGLEDKFSVRISLKYVLDFLNRESRTVGDLVDYISERRILLE